MKHFVRKRRLRMLVKCEADEEEYVTAEGKGIEKVEDVQDEKSVEEKQQEDQYGMEIGDSEKVVVQEMDSVKDGEVVQNEGDYATEDAETQLGSENVESKGTETTMFIDVNDESGDKLENGVFVADRVF